MILKMIFFGKNQFEIYMVWKIRRPAGRKTRVIVSTMCDCVARSLREPCGVPNPLAMTESSVGGLLGQG